MKAKGIKIAAAAIISLAAVGAFQPAPRAQEAAQTSRSVWDGVYTLEQAKRGEALYTKECASCHASDLTGNDSAPPLSGPGFLANWSGLTVGDLFERVRVSMPASSPGKLSRQQNVDVLSYVLSFNSFPAGKAELDPKIEVLKQIRIEATKPDSNSGSY